MGVVSCYVLGIWFVLVYFILGFLFFIEVGVFNLICVCEEVDLEVR